MHRFRIPLCAFALCASAVACGSDEASKDDASVEADASAATKTAPTCEEALDHVTELAGSDAFEGDKRKKALENCKKESTPEQRTCMLEASDMKKLAECMKMGEDGASAKSPTPTAPSGPSGNGWQKGDFNPNGVPKAARLQLSSCNALIAGIDACRKRSDKRLGRMNNDLVLSRRTIYVSAKERETKDPGDAMKACHNYQITLQKSDDCEAAVTELAKTLQ